MAKANGQRWGEFQGVAAWAQTIISLLQFGASWWRLSCSTFILTKTILDSVISILLELDYASLLVPLLINELNKVLAMYSHNFCMTVMIL